MIFDLTGKVAVVSGGYGHLGKAICDGLIEFGAKVYVCSCQKEKFDKVKKNEKSKHNLLFQKMDVSKSTSILTGLNKIEQKEGKIDILINNAVYGKHGTIFSIGEKEWSNGLDGTISSVYRTTKAIIPFFEKSGKGVIINIASIYGMVAPNPALYKDPKDASPPSYAAGKASIINFTKYSASFLGKKNIRVNSISPGPFPNLEKVNDKNFIASLKERIPLGRLGVPQDLKGIIVLLSSDASSFITGSNIVIDGGWIVW